MSTERRSFFKKGLLAAAGISLLPETLTKLAAARPNKSNTVVFTHTTVITGDPNRAALKDVALAVKNGTIAAIGPNDEVAKAYPDAEMIDGRKKAILPGLINCHAHLAATVAKGYNEDFGFPNRSGFKSPESMLSEEERTLMSVIAALHSIRSGTTTVVENTSKIAPRAADLAKTGLRWVFAEGMNDRTGGAVMSPEVLAASTTPVFSQQVREEGLKRLDDLFSAWHGKNNGKIQVFPAVSHTENASPELLKAIRGFAEKHQVGYTIHMNQTIAEVDYMVKYHGARPAEYLYKHDFLGPKLFAAHARYVDQKEMDVLGKTNTIISHQAAMAANRGVNVPIPMLRAAGCPICFGTDNNNNDLYAVMKVAMLTERIKRNDEHPGMMPQPEDILQDASMGGARAIGMEKSLGLLEPGRKADLIVLNTQKSYLIPSGRILSAWLHNGNTADIESVMVEGEFIMRDHKILTVDEDAIVAEAGKVGKRIWGELEKNGPLMPPGRVGWK